MSYLHDLLWSVRGEFLKMIHVTDQKVKDVRRHQCYTLVGVLGDKTHIIQVNSASLDNFIFICGESMYFF